MTTSDYHIGIPIHSYVSVSLLGLPSGLSREQIIARLTPEVIAESGELVYPMKQREEVWEARQTVENRVDEIDIDEDIYEEDQVKTVS